MLLREVLSIVETEVMHHLMQYFLLAFADLHCSCLSTVLLLFVVQRDPTRVRRFVIMYHIQRI